MSSGNPAAGNNQLTNDDTSEKVAYKQKNPARFYQEQG
jgi:hypothetical protein